MSQKTRVLLIAFSDSIHTARWITQLNRSRFDIHLFPSVPFCDVHPSLKNITVHQILQNNKTADPQITILQPPLFNFVQNLVGTRLARKLLTRSRSAVQQKSLLNLIRKWKPQIIHTMETQRAGYLMNMIFEKLTFKPIWIHSTWGIDLHYFQNQAAHRSQIQSLLNNISLLITEGERDILLARELGYTGKTAIIPSVGGGFDFMELEALSQLVQPSQRKKILLKGYEGDERLASKALAALRSIGPSLIGYEVIVYSCHESLLPVISEIQQKKEFAVTSYRELSHHQLLQLTCNARISVTNNLSDGVPNTMLEAMALGTFPVQSNTAITEGWIQDGYNGLLTDPRDTNNIAIAIQKALQNDRLVDEASVYNKALVRERLDYNMMKRTIEGIYDGAARYN